MPHVLKMKDGKLLTPFGIRDLPGCGAGLCRRGTPPGDRESYIDTNVEDIVTMKGSMTAWSRTMNALLTISGQSSHPG